MERPHTDVHHIINPSVENYTGAPHHQHHHHYHLVLHSTHNSLIRRKERETDLVRRSNCTKRKVRMLASLLSSIFTRIFSYNLSRAILSEQCVRRTNTESRERDNTHKERRGKCWWKCKAIMVS